MENRAVLIEAFKNYATAKHGTAVVHVWPNIMIALNELQSITVQIFDDLLQFEPNGEDHFLQRIPRRIAFKVEQIGLDDVETAVNE